MIRAIVADKTTSVVTAQAVASALYAREKSGEGQHIDAMLDVMIAYLWPESDDAVHGGRPGSDRGDPNARPT